MAVTAKNSGDSSSGSNSGISGITPLSHDRYDFTDEQRFLPDLSEYADLEFQQALTSGVKLFLKRSTQEWFAVKTKNFIVSSITKVVFSDTPTVPFFFTENGVNGFEDPSMWMDRMDDHFSCIKAGISTFSLFSFSESGSVCTVKNIDTAGAGLSGHTPIQVIPCAKSGEILVSFRKNTGIYKTGTSLYAEKNIQAFDLGTETWSQFFVASASTTSYSFRYYAHAYNGYNPTQWGSTSIPGDGNFALAISYTANSSYGYFNSVIQPSSVQEAYCRHNTYFSRSQSVPFLIRGRFIKSNYYERNAYAATGLGLAALQTSQTYIDMGLRTVSNSSSTMKSNGCPLVIDKPTYSVHYSYANYAYDIKNERYIFQNTLDGLSQSFDSSVNPIDGDPTSINESEGNLFLSSLSLSWEHHSNHQGVQNLFFNLDDNVLDMIPDLTKDVQNETHFFVFRKDGVAKRLWETNSVTSSTAETAKVPAVLLKSISDTDTQEEKTFYKEYNYPAVYGFSRTENATVNIKGYSLVDEKYKKGNVLFFPEGNPKLEIIYNK